MNRNRLFDKVIEFPTRDIPLEFPFNGQLVAIQAFMLMQHTMGRHNALLAVANNMRSHDTAMEWVRAARYKHVFGPNSYNTYAAPVDV